MEVPGRVGSVNVEVGQNFGTLVVGDHNIVQLAGVAASVVVAQGPAQVHRPTDIPGFLDRRVETARALAAVKPGAVLELVGVPKIGKTALARHAALAGAGDFRDGALLLPPGLAGARDVLQSLFEIFYLATPELAPSATRLREFLAAKTRWWSSTIASCLRATCRCCSMRRGTAPGSLRAPRRCWPMPQPASRSKDCRPTMHWP